MQVLIVDDDALSRKLLNKALTQIGYQVVEAKDGQEGWSVIEREPIRLVITDWIMPKMDGLDLARKIRTTELGRYVYIVILTGQKSLDNVVDGLNAGADDYLVKPFNLKELSARLMIAQRILALEQELKDAHEKMHDLAMHDELTGLWNRRAIYQFATAELIRAERELNPISFILLDIDHFKVVNDTHGHLVGDQALKLVAETIGAKVRPYDRVGRWGGEEFLVVLPMTDVEEVTTVAERIRIGIAEVGLTLANGNQIHVTVSLGATCTTLAGYASLDDLIHDADEALYQAKESGRNRVCVTSLRDTQ